MGLFSSSAGKATIEYGKLNQQVLQNWWNNNSANIGDRANEADAYLKDAGELFKPLSALGEKATGLYADSLGVNGVDGNARADTRIGTGDRISAAGDSFISGILASNNQIAGGYEAKAAAKDKMTGSLLSLGTSILGGGLGGIGGAVGGGTSLASIAKGVGQGLFGYGR